MKKIIYTLLSLNLIFAFMLTSTACSSETKEAEYTVYFTNSQGTALIEDKVNVDENDSHRLAVRLLEIMDTKSGKDNSVIKPSRVNSPDIEFDSIYVNVYFDSTYYDMKPSTEVLYRAAVVKTLSQIDGVTYVRFYVDGKDAVYEDGTNIGNMSSEDFVDSSEGAISDVKWVNINLYY